MRKVELSLKGRLSNRLRLGGGDPADPESMKTRKGKVGGWRDYFTEGEAEEIEAIVDRTLLPGFGYTRQEQVGASATRPPRSDDVLEPFPASA
jgi:hypothetical protein